ncbi:hypothetical protein EU805_10745 [Salipiger sp. IMCC34102]|uniref:hypothetical protein n=1 Tax=Salipiger sp. IMCC34102 TaxID=2510647 RepID=UPI00101BCEBE|nr:hypothetical protein [Salipiger sp. IMCC34102]RYH02318.1 hypothetical protein EU805_10745 [Salipiger sp. IMCC34102]
MIRILTTAALLASLTACGDGQPIIDDPEAQGPDADLDLPPGSEADEVSANSDIFRFEPRDDEGGGLVTDVSYNADNDTFRVDNLGFDGPNVYRRKDGDLATLGGARVYQAQARTPDFLTGDPVEQLTPYIALYREGGGLVDGEPQVSFAIVRSGGFSNFGAGGYVYERNGGVVLPDSGQATFSGPYAGLRIFSPGRAGLEYVRGNMTLDIDFEDFNANDAVKGRVTDRRYFDKNGDRVRVFENGPPDLTITIQEGIPSLNADGEINVPVVNYIFREGEREVFEEGTFTGIIAGDTTQRPGGRVVGVVTVTAEDPREEGSTMKETGGVILTR